MFAGIVEEIGKVARAEGNEAKKTFLIEGRLVLKRSQTKRPLRTGDSVAVNGVCLTVEKLRRAPSRSKPRTAGAFQVTAVAETLRRTTIGGLRLGAKVNLERALNAAEGISGHFVQGHVDETLRVLDVRPGEDYRVTFELTPAGRELIVAKGSVAIEGVSLTVGEVRQRHFSIYLIPFTRKVTTLGTLTPGDRVNVEYDILSKMVARTVRLMSSSES